MYAVSISIRGCGCQMDFQHDIFISYPSTLNDTPFDGWITKFESKLRLALEARRVGQKSPVIYYDKWNVDANSSHAEMLERARNSRIFLAIVSPDYQKRAWAPLELEAFASDLSDLGRLFVIASAPLPEQEIRLEALKGRPIKPFYKDNPDKRKAMPFHPKSEEFETGIYRLAVAMDEKLKKMGAETIDATSSARSSRPQRTILLAQVTDDLDRAHRQVADELKQQCMEHNVILLSGVNYPLGGDAFRQAFSEDLAKADLVVQLLGETLGKRPPDLPEGYVLAQARAAAARSEAKLMQWRRSNLDLSEIDDPELLSLLQGETVMASTLSAFRDVLMEWMKAPPAPEPSAADNDPCGKQVFINAEKVDLYAAVACQEAVSDLCASAWVPPFGEHRKESIQDELNSLFVESDSLFFINGNVDPIWVAKQMRQAVKTRADKRKKIRGAVCNGPPDGKPDLHGTVNGIETLNCRTSDGMEWDFEPVRAYVKRLSGTPFDV